MFFEFILSSFCFLESKVINRKNINKYFKCKFLLFLFLLLYLENIFRFEIEYLVCKDGCLISVRKEIF